jgi:hypothetical protein
MMNVVGGLLVDEYLGSGFKFLLRLILQFMDMIPSPNWDVVKIGVSSLRERY